MPAARYLDLRRTAGESLTVLLAGNWTMGEGVPSPGEVEKEIEGGPRVGRVLFDTSSLGKWDSALLLFLKRIEDLCRRTGMEFRTEGLPDGARKLLQLSSPDRQRKWVARQEKPKGFLERVAVGTLAFAGSSRETLDFVGEITVAFGRLARGKAAFRRSDLLAILQETGAQALPIVSLISFLVGLILAFVGAVQLRLFGAQIYVADAVGIGMFRVMGAVMTGIVMAGRTGAAFAARLGTMQVNEEIDALRTSGIPPMEFLVLPRILALALMMPLLTLYADLAGILGGLFVGVTMLDLSVMEYYHETRAAVTLNNLWIGIFHGAVFGVLVALSGCLRGMQSGRSASAVGEAATSAVVTGIVSIIVATAVITFACEVLGI
jgi:phospholipid/cholesterol/gamma-HCH transport system permease protein